MTGSSAGAGPTITETLAGWTAALRPEDLPAEVVGMARRCLLDTLGCALQGTTTPEAGRLARVQADLATRGPATVWGRRGGVAPSLAALLNGTHAHLRELDDIGAGHAGACQVPAVLAAAEVAGTDGASVLLGLVAGHEVASRLTDAAGYDVLTLRGWHSTGVYGSLGAAAAVARTLGLGPDGTADALGLAGSYTGGLWAFMADGAMSKRIHPGKSAETGLTAAVLARRGVTGPRAVLETAWGGLFPTYLGDAADPGATVRGLGEGFRILRKGFKPYPVCWGVNSAADALLRLGREAGATAGTVSRVRVVLSEMSHRMVGGTRIASVLDAQMSLPYALASILLRGRLTLAEFDEAALADPAAREVMRRIELVVDPRAHGERQTVEVELRDGRRLRERVETPHGHWDDPLSDDELRGKFLGLAGPALGARAADAADLVGEVETPGALGRLLRLLRTGSPGPG